MTLLLPLLLVSRFITVAADDKSHLVGDCDQSALLVHDIDIHIHMTVANLARMYPAEQPFPAFGRRRALDLDGQRKRRVPVAL